MTAPVVTFYSYKGGVGRTQALANVAVRLANDGKRVVAVDMDLESPGVHAFFSPPGKEDRTFQERDFADKPGLLDFLERCGTLPADEPSVEGMLVQCSHKFLRSDTGSVRLLSPGRLDDTYAEKLANFSWERFYSEQHGYSYIELMRRQLCGIADVVLVDSRTGLTDAGMVCTFQLPDTVVVLFALHQQGIDGAERIAKAIARRQDGEPEGARGQRVLLVPSRVDDAAELRRAEYFIREARKQLQPLPKCELLDGQWDRIPYIAWYAYGENIVDPAEDNRLSAAYARLTGSIQTALNLSTEVDLPPAPVEEISLFLTLDSARQRIHAETRALVQTVRAMWNPEEPIDTLPGHGSDVAYHRAEIEQQVRALGDLLNGLATLGGSEDASSTLTVPRILAEWEAFGGVVDNAVADAHGAFFSHVRKQLLHAASDDEAVVDSIWLEFQKHVESATSFSGISTVVEQFDRLARRSSLDAQLQDAALEFDALAARYQSAKERAQWIDQRIQRLMDEAALTPQSADQLENLLRLRVKDRSDEALAPHHWSSYDVLCMLFSERDDRSDRAFRDVGLALWSETWHTFFNTGSLSAFGEVGPECQRQLERVAAKEDEVRSLLALIPEQIDECWRARGASRERILRLFSERRGDPCLKGAMARLAASRDDVVDLCAAWLVDLPPFDGPAFRVPLYNVLEHLAETGRVGEAYYGLLAVGAEDASVLDDRSFLFLPVALLQALVNDAQQLSQAERMLYEPPFSERVGATVQGAALLAILGCGLDGREWPARLRSAARTALLQSVTVDLPGDLDRAARQGAFGDPGYAVAVLRVGDVLSKVHAEGERPIHSSWGLSGYYETELKRLFSAELARIRRLVIDEGLAPSLSMTAHEWMDATYRIVSRDHKGDPPLRGARDKIVEVFDRANAHLADLASLSTVPSARGRTVAEVEGDGVLVKEVRNTVLGWLSDAESQPWLTERIKALLKAVP